MKVPNGIVDQATLLRKLVDTVNGKLDAQGNLSCVLVEVTMPAVAGDVATITHGLGRAPVAYIANPDRSCSVYDYQRSSWDSQTMTLKCSVASAVVNLLIL